MAARKRTPASPVSLATAEVAPATPSTLTYKPVGESKREGSATFQVVESSAPGHPLYLQVTRARKGKPDAVKRHPLAPIAAAIRLGVIA